MFKSTIIVIILGNVLYFFFFLRLTCLDVFSHFLRGMGNFEGSKFCLVNKLDTIYIFSLWSRLSYIYWVISRLLFLSYWRNCSLLSHFTLVKGFHTVVNVDKTVLSVLNGSKLIWTCQHWCGGCPQRGSLHIYILILYEFMMNLYKNNSLKVP